MTDLERNGLTALGWLQRNVIGVLSIVFAIGMAYSQLSALREGLDETRAELQRFYREFVEIRVHGLGVQPQLFHAFRKNQSAIDNRQDQDLAQLRRKIDAAIGGDHRFLGRAE
jgi:hypothetical protein